MRIGGLTVCLSPWGGLLLISVLFVTFNRQARALQKMFDILGHVGIWPVNVISNEQKYNWHYLWSQEL